MTKALLLLLTLFALVCARRTRLNWAVLDSLNTDTGGLKSMRFGALDPDPNSTTTLGNQATDAFDQENSLWNGTLHSGVVTTTWTYVNAMRSVTVTIADFIRSTYAPIFADLAVETCNSVETPPEVVVDANMGFSPNTITLNSTELLWLIPSPSCFPPPLPSPATEPTFSELRKNSTGYKIFLQDLDKFLECILLLNAFPSYAKGVSCLEGYYYGEQDAGGNPMFFDLMASKKDLSVAIAQFVATSMPSDPSAYTPSTWSEYQYILGIARQYKEMARKVRYTAILIYNALSRNYIRLNRVKTCKTLEQAAYQTSQNVPPFWCNYTNCYQDAHNFSLLCEVFGAGHPLGPDTGQVCESRSCRPEETYPDPFYCDTDRDCPNAWYCSLIDRHCYMTEFEKPTFRRSYNKTICGYPRRLADASVVQGEVITAFGGHVNESLFEYATFWPQNCSENTELVLDPSQHEDLGPFQIEEICYAVQNQNYYVNGTTDCRVLDPAQLCFNITYTIFVDGDVSQEVNEYFCYDRSAVGDKPWHVSYCEDGGPAPNVFPDYEDWLVEQGGNLTTGETTYMGCANNDHNCITQNSTHVCYHEVQDIVRVFNYYFEIGGLKCTDQRVYGDPSNITYNYVDPSTATPPTPHDIPTGFDYVGFFNMSASAYSTLTPGGATVTDGPVPTSVEDPDYASFYGCYTLSNAAANTWKLTGRFVFYMANGTDVTVEGNDYFLTLTANSTFRNCSVPGLVVDNATGELVYNPIMDKHPNPRFNDPNECYYMQVKVKATIPMVKSPPPTPRRYKDFWMQGVGPVSPPDNVPPSLQGCAAVFLRKVLYVGDSAWFGEGVTDFPAAGAGGVLRYVCLRSLDMSATCSKFGIPLTSTSYDSLLATVNPPSNSIIFVL